MHTDDEIRRAMAGTPRRRPREASGIAKRDFDRRFFRLRRAAREAPTQVITYAFIRFSARYAMNTFFP